MAQSKTADPVKIHIEQPALYTAAALNVFIRQGEGAGVLQTNDISDGSHTFHELYEHRYALFIALCKCLDCFAWRSQRHSDGELAFGGGWFLLGLGREPGQQITYHLPMEKWEACAFAETLNQAPAWDGHSAADVLERLKNI